MLRTHNVGIHLCGRYDMYPRQWRSYLAIRVITGWYLAHRTASIVSERAIEPGATTVIDHCLLPRQGLILYIILRFLLALRHSKLIGKYC